MTFFRRFSLGLSVFLMMAIVVALACVYFYVRLVDREFLADRGRALGEHSTLLIADHPFLTGILALLLVVLLVNCALSLVAMMLGVSPRPSRHLIIEGEGGQIAVALDAVEDFLQRKGSMVSGVKDLKVNAEVSGGLLAVYSRLHLVLARDIPSFSREFQGLLRNEITTTLGFQNIKEVRVIIQKMETEEPSTRAAPPSTPERTCEPAPPAPTTQVETDDTSFWERPSTDR